MLQAWLFILYILYLLCSLLFNVAGGLFPCFIHAADFLHAALFFT